VTATSPRLDPRLAAAALVLDDRRLPYAETCRRVGQVADRLGLPRPAYDTIRILLRSSRERSDEIRRALEPVVGDLLQGRLALWDVDRLHEAAALATLARRRRAL
jgi:hypothetical protein